MTALELAGPGIYDAIPEDQYHGHKGSLSVSGAKKLLPPSCPAIYKHQLDHGQPPRREFDFGHAAHARVLGVGADIVVVDAADWRTKAAKEAAEAARAEGKVPLLPQEATQVDGMAAALAEHPVASALLQAEGGLAEQSLFWLDEAHGVMRRARLDWLAGRVIADYKTCQSAEPSAVSRAMASYGYHMQADWYREGVVRLGLVEDPLFVLIFQEKTAPYVVTVVEPDGEALRIGRQRNEQALRIYAQCVATDTWPGYATDVELIGLPKWATYLEGVA